MDRRHIDREDSAWSRREALALLTASALWPGTRVSTQSATPTPAEGRVAAADLRADVDLLERALRPLHPGLLRYQTPETFAARMTALQRDVGRELPLEDVYLALSRFTATLQCGHTWVSPFNQSKAVRARLLETGPRLPFWFEWIDRRMVVTRDFSARALPRGTEVVSIDGQPVGAILDALLPLTRADGSNRAKRIAQLGVRGDSPFESVDLYFRLLFDPREPAFDLRVRRPGAADVERVEVAAMSHAERLAPIEAREQARRGAGDVPLFDWTDEPDGTAWLRMQTWALYNSKWDWRGWLNARLDALVERKAPALVVDLRGNEGGEDVGDVLVERLIDRDVPVASLRRLVRYRTAPADLAPALDTWDKSFLDWGDSARPLAEAWPTAPAGVTYFALAGDGGDADARTVLRPAAKRYRGRVIVLVDAVNSSATFQFAELVQQLGVATLVGEPTGGSRRGINGGAFFFLRLPGSGLEVDLPLIGTFPRTPQPDAGVVPDVEVRTRIEDLVAGRDPARGAVARLLAATR